MFKPVTATAAELIGYSEEFSPAEEILNFYFDGDIEKAVDYLLTEAVESHEMTNADLSSEAVRNDLRAYFTPKAV